jgi:hypothetical protein
VVYTAYKTRMPYNPINMYINKYNIYIIYTLYIYIISVDIPYIIGAYWGYNPFTKWDAARSIHSCSGRIIIVLAQWMGTDRHQTCTISEGMDIDKSHLFWWLSIWIWDDYPYFAGTFPHIILNHSPYIWIINHDQTLLTIINHY